MFLFIFSTFWSGLVLPPRTAEAAQVTLDSSVSTTAGVHPHPGSQTVFVSDQVGYKFYVDSTGQCVYSKTSDGGVNWGVAVIVDAQGGSNDCIGVTVWYDRWTPGGTGTYIHVVTMDTSLDDVFYNRLDTNGDTLLMGSSPVDAVTNSGNSVATFVAGANYPAITKGTDGTIYLSANDGSDSYIVECTSNCNLTTGWTETGTNPLDLANDFDILVPLASGNIMIIDRDVSLEDIRYKIWNNTSWSASWTAIDANATDNTTYDIGMAAAVSSSTPGVVYLAYIANNATLGTDDVVRTAKYNGSSWSATTDVINSTTMGLTNVAIGLDAANDDVYVAYAGQATAGTGNPANVYWKSATSSMANWSAQSAAVGAAAYDLYGLDLNAASDQRIFVSYYDIAADDIFGDTIADVFPGVHVTTNGSQTTPTLASTTNFHVGGSFVFYNTYKSFDVTGITITEGGTIDGSTNLSNVKLQYEMDNVAPYNCADQTYGGSESQFGSTDTNGFSGANGVSSFSGSSVTLSTTTALCVYVVTHILDSTANGATIDVSIANPATDVTVTGSTAGPATSQNITGSTVVNNDTPTLIHYHWRNDNGNEAAATSRTGGTEDTALAALQQQSPARLRVEVSNEGGSSTPAMQYRLEYALATGACTEATGWTDVGAANGDFDMYDTVNLTDGNDTTNIAVATGGVTNENTTFLSSNAGVKDTSSQTSGIVLTTSQYVELEYSIVASTTATEGNTYCFRVTDAGSPIAAYTVLPRANIAADVLIGVTGSQTGTTNLPASNFHIGGAFSITENSSSRNVTSITIAENGTVDAQTGLDDIRLYQELDIVAPYDCADETYSGTEVQYGATDTDGFSWANGSSTFTGSVGITTTAAMCVYVVLNSTVLTTNGETLNVFISNPSADVVVSGGGTLSPTVSRDITGSTSFVGAVLTQTHYHWRSDNGTEAAATSLSGGIEDTPITNVAQTTPVRLRVQVSNEGTVTSESRAFQVEYGAKITTCSAVASWTNVGDSGGAWDLYNSTNLTDGNNTTDIAVATGGVTNENTTFLTPNSAVKDTSATVASTTLTSAQFIEAEFSMQQTADAGFDTTYCFRITTTQVPLNAYTTYAELTTSPERDFEIQRGTATITGASITLTAGVDYVAPSASTSAFMRITNTSMTGAGRNAGNTQAQNADDVTAYITNPSNILTSITIARTGIADNTHVSWEIIEFIGTPGSDNEMIVRSQTSATYGTTATIATGTAATVTDDTDVVVFITGQGNPDTADTNYNTGISTSAWNAATDEPVFTRGEAGSDASVVSYAVVEFKGLNWIVQRNEHTYTNAGTTETEAITAVSSLSRTFIHTQKRSGAALNGTDEFGHEVWLSSVGFVSYFLESGATTPSGQTSVAWVIENIQTTSGAMDVTRSNGSTLNGTPPLTVSVAIGKTLTDLTNASIFANARAAGTGTVYPRPIAGAAIASTTHYELWRSNVGSTLTYRTEIVEWPTAGLALKQNYYRLFVDNAALDPTDPWPVGGADLGMNTVLTSSDEPLGGGERIRIRMSLEVLNATLPAGTKAFRLQFGPMVTSCSAISEANWKTVGNSASSTVWRGYDTGGLSDGAQLSGNPPTGGDLNLTVSDVAGTYEEANDTSVNLYAVPETYDIEYDWILEQNGATADTYYCFRMTEADGTLLGGYTNYPQIRTASFTPRSQNWRWYDDIENETPVTTLADENISPVNIAVAQTVALRVTVKETKTIAQENTRFKLQYSESPSFNVVSDVLSTSTCLAASTWCYVNGAAADNAVISTKTLSDAEACSGGVGDGCGTHNESPVVRTGFRHGSSDAVEYQFAIQAITPRVNRVYYFRLYDQVQNIAVPVNTGESYPSLVTEGASLNFSLLGVNAGTTVEGVLLDVNSTPQTIAFGSLATDTPREAAHTLRVSTNATEGYKILMRAGSVLTSAGDSTIAPISTTNASPAAWSTGCSGAATGCFGYHAGDDALEGGSARFAPNDTYAQFSTGALEEVAYSSLPATNEETTLIYKVLIRGIQEAGTYETNTIFIAMPIF